MRFSAKMCAFAVTASIVLAAPLRAQTAGEHWVSTWSTALVARPQLPPAGRGGGAPLAAGAAANGPAAPAVPANQCPAAAAAAPGFVQVSNQTVRQVVRVSLGGSRARVVVSNVHGTVPLSIGAGHVALRDRDAAIRATSGHPLTFSGKSTFTIPAGAVVVSDPADLEVPDLSDLVIDLYVPGTTDVPSPLTMHNGAFQTNYLSEPGNFSGAATFPTFVTFRNWFLISQVQVTAPAAVGTIAAFGDSITDGTRSTPDTNSRWPDVLARRLLSGARDGRMAVVNLGIAGNRVLGEANFAAGVNALARFDRDVLLQPALTHVIVLEGINDINIAGQNAVPSADDIIAGHVQLIERAHARGVTIIGATLTPFLGLGAFNPVTEGKRQAINEWIRTSGRYDAVVDFDKATRDPGDPRKFLAAYDSCDHLHPSDAGYKAMAEAIDTALFTSAVRTVR